MMIRKITWENSLVKLDLPLHKIKIMHVYSSHPLRLTKLRGLKRLGRQIFVMSF